MGFVMSTDQIIHRIYSEDLQTFRLAAEGFGDKQPPEHLKKRVHDYFDPLPFWYTPIEQTVVDSKEFPFFALTQRPMQMYHSWGGQNAWLRQITGTNKLYMARSKAEQMDIDNDDWVWVSSRTGRIRVQVGVMDGVQKDTVWTWNAIGKRKGAWNLDNDVDETETGFLLNHLISEDLPKDGITLTNSDPVTGQAAWFDLRVKIEKAGPDEPGQSSPRFEPLQRPPGMQSPPSILRYGKNFRSQRKAGDNS